MRCRTCTEEEDKVFAIFPIVPPNHAITVYVFDTAIKAHKLVLAIMQITRKDVEDLFKLTEDEHPMACLVQLCKNVI